VDERERERERKSERVCDVGRQYSLAVISSTKASLSLFPIPLLRSLSRSLSLSLSLSLYSRAVYKTARSI
jgi:hypothetical protein